MKFIGLLLFVGIPMPFTGVWTGSLAAYLFGLNTFKSMLTIIGGVLLSSTVVTLISYTSKELLVYFNIILMEFYLVRFSTDFVFSENFFKLWQVS